MKSITDEELIARIQLDNPWWKPPHQIDERFRSMRQRKYFNLFFPFVVQHDPRRAVVLMGPRRVGKTVMLNQAVQRMIDEDVHPNNICCLDLQSPTYSGIGLERLLELAKKASNASSQEHFYMMYDEIQYLKEWEVQLKNAVDVHHQVKFIASGSAAAALRVKSAESGAGRFTDFLLPPVTFYEYLSIVGCEDDEIFRVEERDDTSYIHYESTIEEANDHFVNYLNYGGYPEAILSPTVQKDPGRYIAQDIIEKVLTRDLPSLYGIHDVAELNRLFSMLAYNTAQELSLEPLSQKSGIAKPTIKKYIEYLEAAFLVKILHRIDNNAKKFKRANYFKIYLTNPCMRSALFSPIGPDDEHIGSLVETAIMAQWFHVDTNVHYARWKEGEVDLVSLDPLMFRPQFAVEVKWTDSPVVKHSEFRPLRTFLKKHPDCTGYVTTRTKGATVPIDGREITFIPSASYCYFVGQLALSEKRNEMAIKLAQSEPDLEIS